MDEIELMVEETFRHFHRHFGQAEMLEEKGSGIVSSDLLDELPNGPGVIYHIQRSTSIFVIRTYVSKNIGEDWPRILEKPEDWPSLRLLEGGDEDIAHKLRFFVVDNHYQAEIIHDQLNNRRFPIHEERLCNLSDPGFSWWLSIKKKGFQLSFTMSVSDDSTVKLGPLGDQQLALKNFRALEGMISGAGLHLNIQNEINRVQFSEGEEFLLEDLKDLFEFGVVSEGITDLFKLLAQTSGDHAVLETSWYYLQELAAVRRFWIQVQYDLNAND